MTIIEISEDKFSKMAEYTEKMLKYGGKLMSCISEMGEEYGMSFRDDDEMGYRGNYGNRSRSMMGNRGGYGNRNYGERNSMGYRDDEDDDWNEMGERRGVRGSGRGRRY